mgnify:CR=1 FL=1
MSLFIISVVVFTGVILSILINLFNRRMECSTARKHAENIIQDAEEKASELIEEAELKFKEFEAEQYDIMDEKVEPTLLRIENLQFAIKEKENDLATGLISGVPEEMLAQDDNSSDSDSDRPESDPRRQAALAASPSPEIAALISLPIGESSGDEDGLRADTGSTGSSKCCGPSGPNCTIV